MDLQQNGRGKKLAQDTTRSQKAIFKSISGSLKEQRQRCTIWDAHPIGHFQFILLRIPGSVAKTINCSDMLSQNILFGIRIIRSKSPYLLGNSSCYFFKKNKHDS